MCDPKLKPSQDETLNMPANNVLKMKQFKTGIYLLENVL